jgi:hypothetical protein
METQQQPPIQRNYIVLPPEEVVEPAPFLSVKFILFTLVVMTASIALGLHGKIPSIPFNIPFIKTAAPAAQTQPVAPAATANAAPAAPVPPLNPAAFTVTSISLGQPSFAIINGVARSVGDSVDSPGVTGWKVKNIMEGTVLLQNGSSFATLTQSTPGINPLNDTLHPLN